MVATALEKLQNITPIKFNISLVDTNSTKELTIGFLNNLKTNLGGMWINVTLLILFLFLVYKVTNKNDLTSYDSIRGIFLASGFTLIMSLGVLLSGWSENIYPLFLYGVIFLVSMIGTYELKNRY